jgi:hypothetical protein
MAQIDPTKKDSGGGSWIQDHTDSSKATSPKDTTSQKPTKKSSWISDHVDQNDNITQKPSPKPPQSSKKSIFTRINAIMEGISKKVFPKSSKKYKNYRNAFLIFVFLIIVILTYSVYESHRDTNEQEIKNPYDSSVAGYGGKINDPIKMAKYRDAFSQLKDIDGVIWDENKKSLIFIAEEKNSSNKLQPANLDDFIFIMKIIERGDDPGISIEPPGKSIFVTIGNFVSNPVKQYVLVPASSILPITLDTGYHKPGFHVVKYYPKEAYNTHLGNLMFEADYTLKALSSGVDPISSQPVRVNIPEFKSEVQLETENSDKNSFTPGFYGRIWFTPKESVVTESDNAMIITSIKMGVLSESEYEAPKKFSKFFEDHYMEIANEKPIYQELIRLQKYVAISRWLKERGYSDKMELTNSQINTMDTPYKVPAVRSNVGTQMRGKKEYTRFIEGGIIMDTLNKYESGKNVFLHSLPFVDLEKKVIQSRPENANIWTFNVDNVTYIAIAIS